MSDPIKELGITCPQGGDFYVCSDSAVQFLGCCTVNPCKAINSSCPSDKLKPSSFDEDKYQEIPSQSCASNDASGIASNSGDSRRSSSDEDVALWYICAMNSPPFMGCCTQNPCAKGSCPQGSLREATLSEDGDAAAVFLGNTTSVVTSTAISTTDATTATPSSSSTSTMTSSSDVGATTSSQADNNRTGNDEPSRGATIGIATASSIGCLLLLCGIGYWFHRRRRAAKQAKQWFSPTSPLSTSSQPCTDSKHSSPHTPHPPANLSPQQQQPCSYPYVHPGAPPPVPPYWTHYPESARNTVSSTSTFPSRTCSSQRDLGLGEGVLGGWDRDQHQQQRVQSLAIELPAAATAAAPERKDFAYGCDGSSKGPAVHRSPTELDDSCRKF